MKKIIFLFVLLFTLGSCKKQDDGCIDERLITGSPCTTNYDPVCGCNDVTYGNSCVAKEEGVTSWTDGACD
ncbi:MAG: Kazal-type serine protease inhibitor [Cryomorphaceae bacterium]